MEETRNTLAIILNNRSFKEYDSQVDVYTKDFGRLNLVVKGTKRLKSKMRGHIEPLTFCRIMIIKGKTWDYLGAVVTENAFIKIREDYDKVLLAGKVAKLYLENINQDESQEELFNLLFLFLQVLNENVILDYDLIYSFLMLKFLHLQGFSPELKNYLDTGKNIIEGKHFFDYQQGGIVEERQGKYGLTISPEVIKILRLVIFADFEKLFKLKTSLKQSIEVRKIVNSFFDYNIKY